MNTGTAPAPGGRCGGRQENLRARKRAWRFAFADFPGNNGLFPDKEKCDGRGYFALYNPTATAPDRYADGPAATEQPIQKTPT